MIKEELLEIKVGDRIKFRAWDRDGVFTLTRVVTEIMYTSHSKRPLHWGVRARGYNPFWVKGHEVIEHIKS